MPGEVRTLIVEILGKSKEAVKAFAETDAAAGKSEGSFSKLGAVGGAAVAGLGIAVVGIGALSLKAADEFEKSHAQLQNAIKDTGGRFNEFKGQISKVDSQMEQYGFTNSQTEMTLSTLTRAAHGTAPALKDMGLVADIARARHIDLASAGALVAKVLTGHVALLGRFGIATKDATGHTISQNEAMKRLAQTFGGAAKAQAETFSGQVERLKATGEDLFKTIGLKLIPVIERLAAALMQGVTWLEKHKQVAIALGIAIGTILVVAIAAWTVGMISAAVATLAATWPILAVVAAIAILAVGLTYAYTHCKTFRDVVRDVFSAVKTYVGYLVDFWKLEFEIVKAVIGGVIGTVQTIWSTVSDVFGRVVGFVTGLPGRISSAASGMWDGITGAFRGAINGIIDIWNSLHFTLPKISFFGHDVGGNDIGVPQLQHLAAGGLVAGALGSPQLVVAHGGERVLTPAQQQQAPLIGALTIYANGTREGGLAGDALVEILAGWVRRNGRLPVSWTS